MNYKTASKITLAAIIILALSMICFVAYEAISLYNNQWTSFPWYMALVLPGIYFYAPLLALLVLHLIFRQKSRS